MSIYEFQCPTCKDGGAQVNITRADAETVVHMAEVCYSEGIGPEFEPLLLRLMDEFGSEIVPKYLRVSMQED